MEDFEQQLRDALQRKEPPARFEAKVLASVSKGPPRSHFWSWAEALAASLLVAAGLWAQHEHMLRERAAGEDAKARLELALKITVTELSKIQDSVRTATEEE